ncbi:uncharacterized protein [Montipora foliosa]|uniref:uncharacterized protein n=1 Tax=Montipora foliosa TaxID=591990 RepID=UPI0035F187DA
MPLKSFPILAVCAFLVNPPNAASDPVYANTPAPQPDTCNCRKKPECPLEGKCRQTNVIYQATVTTETTTETYVGLATNLKERYRNHKTSFRHSNRRNETELSNMFGTYKMQRSRLKLNGKFLKNVDPTAILARNVVFV